MFVCKLRTSSCANYAHLDVCLAHRRQTGTVVTRQTYDRAPRLTKPPTAHISRDDIADGHHLSTKDEFLWHSINMLYPCRTQSDQHTSMNYVLCGSCVSRKRCIQWWSKQVCAPVCPAYCLPHTADSPTVCPSYCLPHTADSPTLNKYEYNKSDIQQSD